LTSFGTDLKIALTDERHQSSSGGNARKAHADRWTSLPEADLDTLIKRILSLT
jgi:hypothetical protein